MIENSFVFPLIFFIGTSVGSFLAVLIDRIPRGKSIAFSRSICNSCKKELAWYDLIPIFSYITLLGKCRYCKHKIPINLFITEIFTGFLFVFLYYQSFYNNRYTEFISASYGIFHFVQNDIWLVIFSYIFYLIIFCSLLVIFFIDLEHGIIPDRILGVLIFTILLLNIFYNSPKLFEYLIAGVVSFGFFLFIFLLTHGRGMGFGDVKFSFLIGFFLGTTNTIVALYTAFLTGALISIILIVRGKKKFRKDSLPFAPFLIFGIFLAFFGGQEIINYLNIYLLR